jgi:hypothetical protein
MLACSCLFRLCLAYLIAVESQLIAYDLSVADYESLRTFEPALRTGNEVIHEQSLRVVSECRDDLGLPSPPAPGISTHSVGIGPGGFLHRSIEDYILCNRHSARFTAHLSYTGLFFIMVFSL